jgi:hypothetical protein
MSRAPSNYPEGGKSVTHGQSDVFSLCKYGVEDEHPHGGFDIPDYNESVYFNFFDARAKVGAILRTGNRPSLGYKEFSVNLKLPGGEIAFRAARETSSTNDGFSSGGLTLSVDEPTRTWKLSYRGTLTRVALPARLANSPGLVLKSSPVDECAIDLHWRATCPMFVLDPDGSGNPTPGETSKMGTDHYEQFGTITGRISLGGQSWDIADVPSMRDHTWGPRIWGTFNGEWMCAFLPGGTGMTLYSELQPSGKRVSSGVVMFEGKPHYVNDFEVLTAYDGGAAHEDRHRSVLHAAGLPVFPLDGVINHFSPMTMATGEHRTRLASMTVEFVAGAGGCAFAEFLRPLPPKA